MLSACSGGERIDSSRPVSSQVALIIEGRTPSQVAEEVVDWLVEASPADRDFARELTAAIVSAYDSADTGNSARFAHALDSIKETLSVKKLAKVYVVSARPARLGVLMKGSTASPELISEIRKAYSSDSLSLSIFNNALSD